MPPRLQKGIGKKADLREEAAFADDTDCNTEGIEVSIRGPKKRNEHSPNATKTPKENREKSRSERGSSPCRWH
jgi:hypothetical protein